jgi:hypothetical protein
VGITADPTSVLPEIDQSSPFYVKRVRILMLKILVAEMTDLDVSKEYWNLILIF